MSSDTDALVARVLAGDVDAYGAVVDLHQRDVWAVAASALRDREATADLVQQIFVEAYLHLRRYRKGGDFRAWIRGIARNQVREQLRRRAREHRLLQAYAARVEEAAVDPQEADRRESALSDAQRRCRKELAAPSVRALAMRYDEGLSHAEIAERLGRSVEAVKQLLYRVHVALRDCIQRRVAGA